MHHKSCYSTTELIEVRKGRFVTDYSDKIKTSNKSARNKEAVTKQIRFESDLLAESKHYRFNSSKWTLAGYDRNGQAIINFYDYVQALAKIPLCFTHGKLYDASCIVCLRNCKPENKIYEGKSPQENGSLEPCGDIRTSSSGMVETYHEDVSNGTGKPLFGCNTTSLVVRMT